MNDWLLVLGSLSMFIILIVCPVVYQIYHAILRLKRGEGL